MIYEADALSGWYHHHQPYYRQTVSGFYLAETYATGWWKATYYLGSVELYVSQYAQSSINDTLSDNSIITIENKNKSVIIIEQSFFCTKTLTAILSTRLPSCGVWLQKYFFARFSQHDQKYWLLISHPKWLKGLCTLVVTFNVAIYH